MKLPLKFDEVLMLLLIMTCVISAGAVLIRSYDRLPSSSLELVR